MNTDERKERVVETASATTSSDNSNSGPFAYIITAVAVGLLVVGTLAIGACTSAIATTALSRTTQSTTTLPNSQYDTLPYDDFTMPQDLNEDWEQWLEEYENMYGDANSSNTDQRTGAASVQDVLGFSLAPYGSTIDAELSASDYAGVSNELRDYVRGFVKADKDYTSNVCTCLNEAARDEEARSERIKAALTTCEEAKEHFSSLEVFDVKDGDAESSKENLTFAKEAAVERWTELYNELALLNTTDDVNTVRLWSYDEDVYDATEEAAKYLAQAMISSTTSSTK